MVILEIIAGFLMIFVPMLVSFVFGYLAGAENRKEDRLEKNIQPNLPGIDKSEVIPVKPIMVKENFSNYNSQK